VNGVLLRPLPYPDSERLVWIAPHSERVGQDTSASRGDYLVWKQQTHVFERMAAYGTLDLNLIVGGEASQERVASTGGDFWEITGARPILGRLPADDDEPGLVLSFGLSQRRLSCTPTALRLGAHTPCASRFQGHVTRISARSTRTSTNCCSVSRSLRALKRQASPV
jgi:hypothetical protein